MKRITILLTLIGLGTMPALAQLAQLSDDWGAPVNGQTLVYWGDNMTPNQVVHVKVDLLGSTAKEVNVKRYELTVQPGTDNYFCWGVCYIPQAAGALPFWQAEAQHSIVLTPGTTEDAFGAYHTPNGVMGSNIYRYVWFDVDAPTDSVWCDIEFRTTAVGLPDSQGLVREFTLFPNPALGREVSVRYAVEGDSQGLQLTVHDAVGQVVLSRALTSVQGRVELGTGELPSGVYFATLERNGAQLGTQRLVVGGR